MNRGDIAALGAMLYALGIDIFSPANGGGEEVPGEIEKIARERWEAKKSRNFPLADELRNRAAAMGWTILDKKDGFEIRKA